VVVRKGEIVGEGSHVFSKRHHAEVIALRNAGDGARGADLFLTLEPCSHTGRTPPCVEEIIRAGIKAVYVATRDPNLRVNGKGIERLAEAGITVHEGLCEPEATRLNEPFFHLVRTGKPFVTLKLALSLDGRIATRTGSSRWITGDQARRVVHRLRYEHDAILVGVRTVAQDDPSLDVRGHRRNRIVKMVLDSELRTDPEARLFHSGDPVLIFHSMKPSEVRARQLPQQAELVGVGRDSDGLKWAEILTEAGRRGLNSLLVEGGGTVAASVLRARAVQRMFLFYAPKIIGGDGLPGFGPLGVETLEKALRVDLTRIRRLGEDFLLEARLD
jgi:diaminohydroxyphosphoribosylaminopyrimidine deaminase/5-amino-6-(5-phosphoribosylamino)uracil reductase